MKVYLMQHGEAMSKAEDSERPLNDQGRTNATNVAVFLARASIPIDRIYHSGKCRAEQTAAIVAEQLQIQDRVVAVEGLSPNDDVLPVAEKLRQATEDVLIVGHLPFLSQLAALLLTGAAERPVVQFTNAGIACLERRNDGWTVNWIVTPTILA